MKPYQPRSPRQQPWKLTFVGGTTKQEQPSVNSAANGELAPGQRPLCEARVAIACGLPAGRVAQTPSVLPSGRKSRLQAVPLAAP
ncbi:MAG: hypothetical protein HC890_14810 [Chloroflexaceae bacterium]|nr:hypothetical protein [Chloroflexaceae bacterium]